MNNNDSKFSNGFVLGLIIGAGVVFLLGTKTGKNLLKIISEQGLDGISNLLEEYDLSDLEEEENEQEVSEDEPEVKEVSESSNGHKVQATKKRFFRRIKR